MGYYPKGNFTLKGEYLAYWVVSILGSGYVGQV